MSANSLYPGVEGDVPIAGQEASSLRVDARRMLDETQPAAMVVVGGMPGVAEEVELFRQRFDVVPCTSSVRLEASLPSWFTRRPNRFSVCS